MFSVTLIHKKGGAETPSFLNYEIMNYDLRIFKDIKANKDTKLRGFINLSHFQPYHPYVAKSVVFCPLSFVLLFVVVGEAEGDGNGVPD